MVGWDDDNFGDIIPDGIPVDWDPEEDREEHHCEDCDGRNECPLPQAIDWRRRNEVPEPSEGVKEGFEQKMNESFNNLPKPVQDILNALRETAESHGAHVEPIGFEEKLEGVRDLNPEEAPPPPDPIPQGPEDHHLMVPTHAWHLSQLEIRVARACTISNIHIALQAGHSIKAALMWGASVIREQIRNRDRAFQEQLQAFDALGTLEAVQADAGEQARKYPNQITPTWKPKD